MNGSDELRHSREAMVGFVRRAIDHALPLVENRELPFVTLTYAQSLDGSIARHDGSKLTLSNLHSQKLTHQVRALHDAILVGINTVLSDDPQLNVRLVDGFSPQPVVVDSKLRFPLDACLLRDPCIRPIIVTGEGTASRDKEQRLVSLGARVVRLPLEADGSICLKRLLSFLRCDGLKSVMIEGGAEIISSVLSHGLADQFLLTIAPRLIGGLRAVRSLEDLASGRWPELENIDYQWLAGDLIIRGDLAVDREPIDSVCQPRVVVGLWGGDSSSCGELREMYRSITIAWARYGYRGLIIERETIADVLTAAHESNFRYCFVMTPGCVVHECWLADEDRQQGDFFTALSEWAASHEFAVVGVPAGDALERERPQPLCLLVDLQRIDAALDRIEQSTVAPFPAELRRQLLDVGTADSCEGTAMARLIGERIVQVDEDQVYKDLTADQQTFVTTVRNQTANARRGVFLWNIESYDDVESVCDDFAPPISTLYTVAAGFKPNRILHTHGFSRKTRVVYFDYSPNALEIKRTLVDEWDGCDYPQFVRYLFGKFPPPETFYQLWDNATPEQVRDSELRAMWSRELERWGGSSVFQEHWKIYRELPHEYICCDLLSDDTRLLRAMLPQQSSVIWWSNAFFTMYGNWFYSMPERHHLYCRFIEQLTDRNPELHLFGSDYNNINVNGMQAAEYWEHFRRAEDDYLNPPQLHRTVVRM